MAPTAYNDWRLKMISTAIIRANFDGIPADFSVIPADFSVIPADFSVIPAQAGISNLRHGYMIPDYSGMTV